MDFIELGGSLVVDGLGLMLESALGGSHGYTNSRFVEVPIALLVIEIAKIAEDREEWFPCGKWATIQMIQERIERELKHCFGR